MFLFPFQVWNTSASSLVHESCPICKERIEDCDGVKVRQKGADGINAASVRRGDSIVVTAGCKVNLVCCKQHINQHDIENQSRKVVPPYSH